MIDARVTFVAGGTLLSLLRRLAIANYCPNVELCRSILDCARRRWQRIGRRKLVVWSVFSDGPRRHLHRSQRPDWTTVRVVWDERS